MALGRNTKTFAITVDTRAFEALMKDVIDANRDAAQPSALAGAKVLHTSTVELTPQSQKGHWFSGYNYRTHVNAKGKVVQGTGKRYWFNPGNLRKSIYMVLSKDNTGQGYATYHISWNYGKAPYAYMVHNGHVARRSRKGDQGGRSNDPIAQIHNGTSKVAAIPFVTMAYDRSAGNAGAAIEAEYLRILTERGVLS